MATIKKQKVQRKYEVRTLYKKIYIFTEGKKTEKNYFDAKKKEIQESLRRKQIEIIVEGTGRNTLSLVEYALNYIDENAIDLDLDECWVVFDKDSFLEHFDNAIQKAEAKGLRVAYSNEAFELWYILHLDYMDTGIGREEYKKRLTDHLRKLPGNKSKQNTWYEKNSNKMYALLKHKETDAIRNAKRLLKAHQKNIAYSKKLPSTTVHLLVESLNGLS